MCIIPEVRYKMYIFTQLFELTAYADHYGVYNYSHCLSVSFLLSKTYCRSEEIKTECRLELKHVRVFLMNHNIFSLP